MRKVPFLAFLTAILLTLTATPARAEPAPYPNIEFPNFDLVKPGGQTVELRTSSRKLQVSYTYDGRTRTLENFLSSSSTQGFVVLDGQTQELLVERYHLADRNTRFQSWSMAKSFTSAAIGIAIGEGHIRSVDDPVTKYIPELAGSGYAGVSLRHLLWMSSGVTWDETLDVPGVHVGASIGVPLPRMAAQRVRGWEPGTRFNYTSMNSFVLAWAVTKATGVPYERYVERKLWQPAGMGSAAYLGNDSKGNSMGYCCYYATARDFARFGLLYLNGGQALGRQVVPRSWVEASTRPSAPSPGYGLHWWLGEDGEFMAQGFLGQTIYVSPRHKVVIVKSTLITTGDAGETMPAFRATAAEVARTRAAAR
ncbi:serine hydrolase [Actinomadura craniellae]|uniref:Serine hydrolase n=1 Tax=Actinomadura craniellae TaxID=2231787 RepID=A0A365H514_9ACTN|nr:serine hydrolase [Actinomadura craniellae]RAY14200.1 serine hydrolase [Actinomadura craniellae]